MQNLQLLQLQLPSTYSFQQRSKSLAIACSCNCKGKGAATSLTLCCCSNLWGLDCTVDQPLLMDIWMHCFTGFVWRHRSVMTALPPSETSAAVLCEHSKDVAFAVVCLIVSLVLQSTVGQQGGACCALRGFAPMQTACCTTSDTCTHIV